MHVIDLDIKHSFAKHEFDLLSVPSQSSLNVRRAEISDAEDASKIVERYLISATVDVPLIRKIIAHNNDGFFLFEKNKKIVGLYVMLMLNELGMEKLLHGKFDGTKPPLEQLAKTPVSTAGIYVWAYVAPGKAANGIRYVSSFMKNNDYKYVNFFARPVTVPGFQITKNLGFQPLDGDAVGLYQYTRIINRNLNMKA